MRRPPRSSPPWSASCVTPLPRRRLPLRDAIRGSAPPFRRASVVRLTSLCPGLKPKPVPFLHPGLTGTGAYASVLVNLAGGLPQSAGSECAGGGTMRGSFQSCLSAGRGNRHPASVCRRALSRRLPVDGHRLWGLSDADHHRCHRGEREHRRVGRPTRWQADQVLGGFRDAPPTSTTEMTPHGCAPSTLSPDGPVGLANPPNLAGTLPQAPVSVKQPWRKGTGSAQAHGAGSSGARLTPS